MFGDTVATIDVLINNLGKGVSDTASAIDVFLLTASFNTPLTDTVTASDILTQIVGHGRSVTDSATYSDAGVLITQDYVSGSYFVDDYVVGNKRTF